MLRFVIQKMRNRKWMVLCLLLGNLLMVSIAAAAPMYSAAALQRTLMSGLSDYLMEKNVNPASAAARTLYMANKKDYVKMENCQNVTIVQ